MHDHLHAARLAGEHAHGRVVGVARVDDQRLAGLGGQRDLRLERALLVGPWRAVAIEVEAGLADRHAARVVGQRAQLGEVGAVEAVRAVGVPADRGEHLREGLGRLECAPA